MAEAPNPYRDWLGVPSGERPRNHYELLGIAPFENDPAVIGRAADVLTARVRSVRPGPHLAEWQRLLDALAGAKACLLDPQVKAAYDAWLRSDQTLGRSSLRRTESAGSRASDTPGSDVALRSAGVPPGPGSDTDGTCPTLGGLLAAEPAVGFPPEALLGGLGSPVAASRPVRSRERSPAQIAVYLLTGLLLVVAAVFGYMLYERHFGKGGGDRAVWQADLGDAAASPAPANPPSPRTGFESAPAAKPRAGSVPALQPNATSAAEPRGEPRPGQPARQPFSALVAQPAPPGPRGQAPASSPAGVAAASTSWAQCVARVRALLAEHDPAEARRLLKVVSQRAQTPDERAEVDRLDTLADNLEEFWKAIRRIVARLEPTEVLPVGDTYVAVVEVSAEELTIKVEGQLRTYPISRIPSRLVQALAAARLGDDPATKVIVGTYLLVDPNGDPARARQLWEEAVRAGLDVRSLLPELECWSVPPGSGGAAGQKVAPPPDPERLRQAQQAVRERFKIEYQQATSVAEKSRLARSLLEAARATDDADQRFVMLGEARDAAASVGEAGLACEAIAELARGYQVDGLAMQAAALLQSAENARGAGAQKAAAQTALGLAAEAIEARRIEQARQLAEAALIAARKSSSRSLMQQALLLVQQVEALQKQTDQGPAPQ